MTTPLGGIRVVELCNGLTNAQAGQMLADFGAEVVQIEPLGGTPLRKHPSYPLWGRGKKSIELNLKDEADLAFARQLIEDADVLLEAFQPGVAERLGLGYASLSQANPRLIHSSITGWGRNSPYASSPGYEGLVMAKVGAMGSYGLMTERPGPSFLSAPYASWSATQMALQGIIAALRERETSGRGQFVETNLALALGGVDPWNQMLHTLTQRYPDAFLATAAFDENKAPATSFPLRLLVAPTADGHWLQFSQVQPRLFQAMMKELELEWMYDDPEWSTMPEFEDTAKRTRANEILIEAVRKKTLAEWQEIFERNPNVFAEVYRKGTELLHHPQVLHDRLRVEVVDHEHGPTLQPAPLVRLSRTPAAEPTPAPQLDADREELRTRPRRERPEAPSGAPEGKLPLEGTTILELGTFYAAPYGATLLTDLGARVIKVEQLDGEPLRMIVAFPEAGAAKVLQGKESIAVDIGSPEGREVVKELARRSDAVLRSFRAGVAERLGLDADSLLAVNPDLIYLDAPGYGIDGPYGHRPAFAPTISAGAGFGMRNIGQMESPEEVQQMSLEQARMVSVRLTTAGNSGGTQPDGVSALAVGTALALGLYLKARGQGGQRMLTTMLLSAAHALSETMVEYDGKVGPAETDSSAYGLNARYRLYQATDGWVFLAAPQESEWSSLVAELAPYTNLERPEWSTEEGRQESDAALAAELEKVFARRPAADWERDLLAAGVGCVVAEERPMEAAYMELADQSGYLVDAVSPIFDEHPRLTPLVGFSRSATQALPGCALGQHTEAVLSEIGCDADRIATLREKGLIAD